MYGSYSSWQNEKRPFTIIYMNPVHVDDFNLRRVARNQARSVLGSILSARKDGANRWSGWKELNLHIQLGKLLLYR